MKCSICGVNESIIHITFYMSNQKRDLHLCSECISKIGFEASNVDDFVERIIDIFNSSQDENFEEFVLFDRVIDMVSKGKENSKKENKVQQVKEKDVDRCPYCNTTYEEIISTSQLGCVMCLDFFNEKIKSKPPKFEGRIPKAYRNVYIYEKLKSYLDNKIKVEVIKENFEKASKIKKIINKLVK
ncbi:MAG: hypothetical protein ACP5PT_07170 [Brevinematia bacterium]